MFATNDLLSVVSKRAYSSRDFERSYGYALPFLVGAFEGLAAAARGSDRKKAAGA
jgi:hypothetical protein